MKTWHPSENKMATTGKDKLPDQNSQINPYENRKTRPNTRKKSTQYEIKITSHSDWKGHDTMKQKYENM